MGVPVRSGHTIVCEYDEVQSHEHLLNFSPVMMHN